MPAYPDIEFKTMKYASPSGTINITKLIPPFKDVVGGFGYEGVLAEDTGSGHLQCHICGKWYELLSTHISFAHKIETEEYQERFGLLRGTVLRSSKMREMHSRVMVGLRHKYPRKCGRKFEKGNAESANRKGKPKALEAQNKFGVCDLQMADKIKSLATKLGHTPSLCDVADEYGAGTITLLHYRYGSYIKFVRSLGLVPVFSSYNPKYSKEYFINAVRLAQKAGIEKIALSKIFDENEQRAFYNHYKSWKDCLKDAGADSATTSKN